MSSPSVGRRACVIVVFLISPCLGIIYHLNESEYARMPALYGLDEFGSCLVPANGTYCLVRVDLQPHQNNSLIKLIQEYSENTVKHYNHSYLQRGVCVTKSCHRHIKNNSLGTTEGLSNVLDACLNESLYTDYGLESKLTELYYCEKKGQQIEIDLGDWIVLGVYVSIMLANCVGTLYDIIISSTVRDTKGNKYLLSFSIIRNWKRLTSKETEEVRKKRLTGLHGARVFSIFLMFTAHVMWVNTMGFYDNIQEFEELYENAYYQMIFNGLVVVQVFFVISGFLLAYNLEVYAETNHIGWMLAPKIWIMRWWRLTPAYAVMLAFMTTWLRHLGSGPLWRMFVTDSVVGDCRRYWWAHLLYINNYIDDGYFCAIQTWHIATDTQLFCVGLFAYMATRRRGRWPLIAAIAVLGVLLPAAHVWAEDLDGLVLVTPEFYRTMINATLHHMHVYGHNNLVCYAIGMGTGLFVHRLQKRKADLSDNKWLLMSAWLVVPGVALVFYSGSIFYWDGPRLALAVRMAYAAVHRPAIGLLVAAGLIGLGMRLNTVLRTVFEWRGWLVPSRLSYSVYLLHLFPIHAHIGLNTHMGHASTLNLILFHFGVMVLTFAIALPFCLLVEAPLMALAKAGHERPQDAVEQTKF